MLSRVQRSHNQLAAKTSRRKVFGFAGERNDDTDKAGLIFAAADFVFALESLLYCPLYLLLPWMCDAGILRGCVSHNICAANVPVVAHIQGSPVCSMTYHTIRLKGNVRMYVHHKCRMCASRGTWAVQSALESCRSDRLSRIMAVLAPAGSCCQG